MSRHQHRLAALDAGNGGCLEWIQYKWVLLGQGALPPGGVHGACSRVAALGSGAEGAEATHGQWEQQAKRGWRGGNCAVLLPLPGLRD